MYMLCIVFIKYDIHREKRTRKDTHSLVKSQKGIHPGPGETRAHARCFGSVPPALPGHQDELVLRTNESKCDINV